MSFNLLINSTEQNNDGQENVWNPLQAPKIFIDNIDTITVNAEEHLSLDSLISGIPSPWARVKLFNMALLNGTRGDEKAFSQYYANLKNEWRGLLAVMALYDRIHIEAPLYLDGLDNEEEEPYDIASTFGEMLFDDRELWLDSDGRPFIQLIKYHDILIGATSPWTGCFTGVDYDLGDNVDIWWYQNKKLTDPTEYLVQCFKKGHGDQLKQLYLFITNLYNNSVSCQKENRQASNGRRIELEGLIGELDNWREQITKAVGKGKLPEVGPAKSYPKFEGLYKELFQVDVPVYWDGNTFTYKSVETLGEAAGHNAVKIDILDIQKVLSEDKYLALCDVREDNELDEAAVYYLKIKSEGKNGPTYYLTLPLSPLGLDIWQKDLGKLLSGEEKNYALSAKVVQEEAGRMVVGVTLRVVIDEIPVTVTHEYDVYTVPANEINVVLWPNFISDPEDSKKSRWNSYYLYDESPKTEKVQFEPIFTSKGKFLKTGKELCTPSNMDEEFADRIERIVTNAVNKDRTIKYNILKSQFPIVGLRVKVPDTNGGFDKMNSITGAGYLIRKDINEQDVGSVNADSKDGTVVGFDFGSNNTCVYYMASHENAAKPVEFRNYRMMLLGKSQADEKAAAVNNELLFFPSYESLNGQIKSWLHEQNERDNDKDEAISGGTPVNRPNIAIKKMDEKVIYTSAGVLHYNMKWLEDEKNKKKAFLKSVWLEVCAYLYKQGKLGEGNELWYSYPGSMQTKDRKELGRIFRDVIERTPVTGVKFSLNYESLEENNRGNTYPDGVTEAEAIYEYITANPDSQSIGHTLALGLDVGGSTTDILLLSRNQGENETRLRLESSVRLAAGEFFDAVIYSSRFRNALVKFCKRKSTKVYVDGIDDIVADNEEDKKKAPFYFNSILDQLRTPEDYKEFYKSLDINGASFVFTIPAYVTGLLLFYTGILVGKTLKEFTPEVRDSIDSVNINILGKGGKLFGWLDCVASGDVNEYYRKCLNAGIGLVLDNKTFENVTFIKSRNNKSEVAFGLCHVGTDNLFIGKQQLPTDESICGETVQLKQKDGSLEDIGIDAVLKSSYFDFSGGNGIVFGEAVNFNKFMDLFLNFVSVDTNLCPEAKGIFGQGLGDLGDAVFNYLTKNDLEFRKAMKGKGSDNFDYKEPVLIIEGRYFLYHKLIPEIFKRQ